MRDWTHRVRVWSRRIALAGCLSLATGSVTPATAGWVDDWVTQKTSSSPNFYSGAKRGYFTAGSFDARWNLRNDYLWSITLPKLKTGCGGIDAFMGGMSFLNTDYLVAKLERIMNAAPAAAFDVALKVFAPQVSDTIRSMESLASKLNNIQLDECRASKSLVATLMTPTARSEEQKSKLSRIQADWWQTTGVGDLWTEFQKLRKADNDKPDPAAASGSMSGCSAEFRDVFAGGSVLDNAAAKIGLTNADYIRLMRGYIGDIYIEAPNPATGVAAYKVVYDPPCEKNTGLDDFLNGDAEGKAAAGACTPIPDANKNLQQYVRTRLIAIRDRITSRQPLAAADRAFLNSLPLPAVEILENAVASGLESSEMLYLGEVAGRAYAYRLLMDLFAKTDRLLYTAQSIMSTQDNPTGNNSTATCRIDNVDEAAGQITVVQERARELMDAVRKDLAATLSELNALETYVSRRKVFSDEVRRQLKERFSGGLAERLMPKNG